MEFRRITDRPTAVIRQATVRPLALRWKSQRVPRWAAWAERLLRRHALGTAAWYALDAILRQTPAGRRETFVDLRSSLAFGLYLTIPSVRIMIAPPPNMILPSASAGGERDVIPMQIVRAALTERFTTAAQTRRNDRVMALTERARAEQHYHEAPSPFALLRQSNLRVVNTRALAAVERIYARQGLRYEAWGAAAPLPAQVVKQSEPSPAAAANQASPLTPDAAFTPLRHWQSAAPQAAPPDIQRLTDQVIQSIDQRLIASRERFGRR